MSEIRNETLNTRSRRMYKKYYEPDMGPWDKLPLDSTKLRVLNYAENRARNEMLEEIHLMLRMLLKIDE